MSTRFTPRLPLPDLTGVALDVSPEAVWTHPDRRLTFDEPIEGSVAADGTEQVVFEDEPEDNPVRSLEGYIDLSALQEGDEVTVRQYISLLTGPVEYRLYAEETYSGVQPLPLLFLATKTVRYGVRGTIEQTAGTPRTFPFQFMRKRSA